MLEGGEVVGARAASCECAAGAEVLHAQPRSEVVHQVRNLCRHEPRQRARCVSVLWPCDSLTVKARVVYARTLSSVHTPTTPIRSLAPLAAALCWACLRICGRSVSSKSFRPVPWRAHKARTTKSVHV